MILDDEFRMEDEDDEKCIEFIKNYMPSEMKGHFTDDDLQYIIDVLADYYAESGILDAEPDKDGYIDIDLDNAVEYVIKESKKQQMGPYNPEELFFVVQGEMEYTESIEE